MPSFAKKKDDRQDRTAKNATSRMNQADDEVQEGFDAGADAYELPPPVHDGAHIVEVRAAEGKEIGDFETLSKDGEPRKHFFVPLTLTVVGKSDPNKGRIIFDNPNTMPRSTSKGTTNAVATLLRRFGGKPSGRPHTDSLALKSLLGKKTPTIQVVTRWEAQYDKETKKKYKEENDGASLKPFLVGEANFPEDPNNEGQHVPVSEDDQGRSVMTTAVVRRYEDMETAS